MPLLSVVTQARPPARTGRRIIGYAVVILCLVIALGCGLTAAWLFLAPMLGAAWTALGIAGLAFAIAILTSLGLAHVGKSKPIPALDSTASALVTEAVRAVSTHKSAALLGALLLGEILGSLHDKRR
jgi:hypothetical protein